MNQSEKRLFLLQSLLKENAEYRNIDIPAEPESQRQLLRGLMNIRAPQNIGADFLNMQDEYLQGETAAKVITDIADLTPIQPGRHSGYVQRRILSLSHAGRVLGVLEPVYLHQPLSGCAQAGL